MFRNLFVGILSIFASVDDQGNLRERCLMARYISVLFRKETTSNERRNSQNLDFSVNYQWSYSYLTNLWGVSDKYLTSASNFLFSCKIFFFDHRWALIANFDNVQILVWKAIEICYLRAAMAQTGNSTPATSWQSQGIFLKFKEEGTQDIIV